jgi:hypothetical protein
VQNCAREGDVRITINGKNQVEKAVSNKSQDDVRRECFVQVVYN